MTCRVKFSILSEGVSGDIGNDWAYTLQAAVYNPGLQSTGQIKVDEHLLEPDTTQAPPNSVAVELRAGPCGSAARISLQLKAREVDWLIDDTHPDRDGQRTIPIECPGPGGGTTTLDEEIAVQIKERPGLGGGSATFAIKVRLEAVCR